MIQLTQRLIEGYKNGRLLPAPEQIFQALNLVPPSEVKVVILGQDPYHNGHAHGLAFSSLDKTTPASLRVIFKEIARDVLGVGSAEEFKRAFPTNDLTCWAKQGVLLLNTILTVQPGLPKSCQGWGWDQFTKAILHTLMSDEHSRAYVLWGKDAQAAYRNAVMTYPRKRHKTELELEAGHPATASYGKDRFTGCGHFSTINEWLRRQNKQEIIWSTEKAPLQTL